MTTKKICPNCAAVRNLKRTKRTETYSVRGEEIPLIASVDICETCGEAVFDEKRDQALLERAYAEYRRRRELLSPAEIKAARMRFRLSQRALATLLGMGQATIARYEGGALQDEAHDQLIRVYSKPQNMKVLLEGRGHLISSQQAQCAKESIQGMKLCDLLDVTALMHGGPDEYTGFRPFDLALYTKTVLWFCCNLQDVAVTKMNKLLFYADYVHYKLHATSITGAAYKKLQYGPVPEHHGTLRDLMEAEGYISLSEVTYHDYFGVVFDVGPRASEIELDFDDDALAILKFVAESFGSYTARQLSEKSHRERAWTDTPDRALISYVLAEHITDLE